ncbi:hypothetical protein PIB30_076744 [Stylosanthes scabra]|uniref:Uncharacterized protein n=1 Tax=Stylosanthes scabra TaxID=79078 RepID=A0ABU6RQT2_9FABA|nr:hypothetical protein [Stylosanthes scabra]
MVLPGRSVVLWCRSNFSGRPNALLANLPLAFRKNEERKLAYTIMMQTTPRHPLIKPRRGPYPYLSTDRRESPRICVDHQPLPKSSHA